MNANLFWSPAQGKKKGVWVTTKCEGAVVYRYELKGIPEEARGDALWAAAKALQGPQNLDNPVGALTNIIDQLTA